MMIAERLRRASFIPDPDMSHHKSTCTGPQFDFFELFEHLKDEATSPRHISRDTRFIFDPDRHSSRTNPVAHFVASDIVYTQHLGNFIFGLVGSVATAVAAVAAVVNAPLLGALWAGAAALGGLAKVAEPTVRGLLNQPPGEELGLCAAFLRGAGDVVATPIMLVAAPCAILGTGVGVGIGAAFGALRGGARVAYARHIDPLWNCGPVSTARSRASAVTERVLSCPRPTFTADAYEVGFKVRQRFAALGKKPVAVATAATAEAPPPARQDTPKGP
jgi:hypothetical protein